MLELSFLAGGGEMGARMRALDWSATALGPPATWPQSLRSTVSMLLLSRAPIVLCWGPGFNVFYNDAYRPVFGVKHPDALGRPGREVWSEIWDSKLHPLLEGVVRTGEAFWARDLLFEIERHGFLEETYFDVSYDPVRAESGDVGGVFCIVTDTTERVVGTRRLALLRDLAAHTLTARTEHDACAMTMSRLGAHPDDVAFALAYLDDELQCSTPEAEARLSDAPPDRVQTIAVPSSTGSRPAHLVLGINPRRPLDDQYKSFLNLVADQLGIALTNARAGEHPSIDALESGADDSGVKPFAARDLAARVPGQIGRGTVPSAEAAQTARLASIFEHTPVGVATLRGPAHVFDFANREYVRMVGGRPLLGRPARDALPELLGQGLFELLDGAHESGTPHVARSLRVMLDRGGAEPEERFFDFVCQPLTEGDRVEGIALVCFEVTDLAKARRDAELASRAKDEFLAMLGHELRNPLAPILTALQLMNLRGLTGAERERRIIERQVKHVVALVDDLLDVSRITRGMVELHKERLALSDVIAKAIEIAEPAIEDRRHMLHADIPAGLKIDGDPARLAQIFANLLNNAAKYTDPGGAIRITARRRDQHVEVQVSDNGSGIAPEMLPHIFELFAQERQDVQRAKGGLGIGLAIVKNLVQAHGGTVRGASAGRGRGTTLTVSLPAAGSTPIVETQTPMLATITKPVRRVLLVDDNEDAATLLAESLRRLGHEVLVAHDGPGALNAVQAFHPDVALLDIGLPVMDGFELAERLRSEPQLSNLTLIAITGYTQDVDRRRTSATGFNAHLAKPIDVYRLDGIIRGVPSRSIAP